MGAYAHPKLLEMVLGGVTNGMLSEAGCRFFFPTDRINREMFMRIKFSSSHVKQQH